MIRFDAMTIEDEEKSEDERMKKKALKLAIDWYRKSAEQDNEETVGALNIEELFSIHSLHYEVLEGDKAGISSIRVNDQYRIKFTVFNQEAETVVYICNILESSVRMLCRKYIDEVSAVSYTHLTLPTT